MPNNTVMSLSLIVTILQITDQNNMDNQGLWPHNIGWIHFEDKQKFKSQEIYVPNTWHPWNFYFRYDLFHKKIYSITLARIINMIRTVPALIIFGKIYFLQILENDFLYENKTWWNYKFSCNSWRWHTSSIVIHQLQDLKATHLHCSVHGSSLSLVEEWWYSYYCFCDWMFSKLLSNYLGFFQNHANQLFWGELLLTGNRQIEDVW